MGKILIIGSSYSIKNTFSKKYLKDDIDFVNFRFIWENRDIDNYDIIILSGYHHKILQYDFSQFNHYIESYFNFILHISKKTQTLFFISTYIPKRISLSRVVFMYKKLSDMLQYNKTIKILSFKKIIDDKFRNSLIFKFLKLINFEFTDQNYLINFTNKFYTKEVSKPKFFFLKLKRYIFFERIIRLFDFD